MRLPLLFVAVQALTLWASLWISNSVSAQANSEVGSLLGQAPAHAEPFPELAAIAAQIDEVAKRPDAHVAVTWLTEARGALQQARTLAQSRQNEAAARAQQLALAALAAASHTIARHQAELELAATQRRRQLAQQAAAAAQQALAHARAQRTSLATPSTQAATP